LSSKTGRKWKYAYPTLEDAGFEGGDFLPLYNFNPGSDRENSFTSTTYAGLFAFSMVQCIWNELFPAGATTHVYGSIMLSTVGADETVSLRIYNGTDDEVVGELTGITATGIKTIDADYEPTTLDSRIWMRWEWKESPGANSSTVQDAFICLGVKL